jgi:hypothetical protein
MRLSCPHCTDANRTVKKIILALYDFCPYDGIMRKTGRPKNPPGTAKGEYLELRLDVAEKQAFKDAATLAGMALSVWVRERLRKVARKELEDAEQSVAFLERAPA